MAMSTPALQSSLAARALPAYLRIFRYRHAFGLNSICLTSRNKSVATRGSRSESTAILCAIVAVGRS
jgi:hypothetical protein